MAMQVQDSKDIAFKYPLVALMGPMGHGKTRCAATAEDDPSKLLWMLFDSGGTDSLSDIGVNVKVLDFSGLPTHELLQALREVRPLIRERVASGQTSTVVADSISVLDKLLVAHFTERMSEDKTKLYNAVLTEHTALYSFLKSLNCKRVATFHEKVVQVREGSNATQNAAAKNRLTAEGISEGKLTIDISGQGAGLYRGNAMVLMQERVREGQGYKYFVSANSMNAETRARFSCLSDREPAHLGQLFAKIRAHLEKVQSK